MMYQGSGKAAKAVQVSVNHDWKNPQSCFESLQFCLLAWPPRVLSCGHNSRARAAGCMLTLLLSAALSFGAAGFCSQIRKMHPEAVINTLNDSV
jgi:hypothetical protein